MNNHTIGFHHKITLLCVVCGNTEIKNYNSTHTILKKNSTVGSLLWLLCYFWGSSRSLDGNRQELNK